MKFVEYLKAYPHTDKMLVLLILLLLIWCIKILGDANRRGMLGWFWAVACFLLPLIFLPVYYITRKPMIEPEPEWVCVYIHQKELNIQIAQDLLSEEDIESVVMDKKDSNYHFGNIQLHVLKTDYDKARAIITANNL